MIAVTLEVDDFLSLGTTPETGNLVRSFAYVPGSVFRGALAAAWIREKGTPNRATPSDRQEFLTLFEGSIHYGPLLPQNARVAALSELRCKYAPKPSCSAFVSDLATRLRRDISPPPTACPSCDGPLEAGKGEIRGVELVESTRVALTAGDETAVDGQLYGRLGLPSQTVLAGRIRGDHAWLRARSGSYLRLGGTLSVSGSAKVTLEACPQPAPQPRSDGVVCIRLSSPGIFVDDATRPQLDPREDELKERLGSVAVQIERRWVRPVLVGGWHAASHLPKPMEHAASLGSTWWILPSRPVGPDALARLEAEGLGLRRTEGFGSLCVNPSAPVGAPAAPITKEPQAVDPESATESPYDLVLRLAATQDRDAIAGLLYDRLHGLERGREPDNRPFLAPRYQRMALELRAALRTVYEARDVERLRALVARLETPAR